jgi:hypothetical protein
MSFAKGQPVPQFGRQDVAGCERRRLPEPTGLEAGDPGLGIAELAHVTASLNQEREFVHPQLLEKLTTHKKSPVPLESLQAMAHLPPRRTQSDSSRSMDAVVPYSPVAPVPFVV